MPGKFYILLFTLVFFALLSCTSTVENRSRPDGSDSCEDSSDCSGGEICVDEECRQICNDDTPCDEGYSCDPASDSCVKDEDSDGDSDDTEAPFPSDGDEIDIIVDGDSSPDGDSATDGDEESCEKCGTQIQLDPSVLSFGSSPPGFDNRRYFLVKNTGEGSVHVTKIRFDDSEGNPGNADGAFSLELIEESTPPLWIEGGYSLAVNVNFKPIADVHPEHSNVVGRICVDWKDEDQNNQSTCIDLLGSVVDLQPACIAIQPLEGVPGIWGMGETPGPGLKFGYSQLDAEHTREIEICNCGDLPLDLSEIDWNEILTGPPQTPRAFVEEPGSFADKTLERGQCIYIPITYYPTQQGIMNTAAIQLKTNAETFEWLGGPQPPDTPIEYQGMALVGCSGIAARRGIEALPTSLDFGRVTMECCSRPQKLTIYNVGDLELEIADISIGAGSDEEFELLGLPSADEFPIFLGGDSNPDQMHFNVKFCPSFEGRHNARVEITSNDDNAGQMIIPLKGEGILRTYQVDEFTQPCAPMVDILWVVDCSGSMSQRLSQLAGDVGDFIDEAYGYQAKLHLAVTSMDLQSELAGGAGSFFGDPAVLDSESLSKSDIIEKISGYITELDSCEGAESGLEAANLALSEPLMSNENAGFLRDEAKLSVIFISDEPDQSLGDASLYIDYFSSIKGMGNSNMLEIYAIVGDTPDGCETDGGGFAAAGPQYISVADACNIHDDQHFVSICEESYGAVFETMAANLFTLYSQFFLSRLADPDTILVTINGEQSEDFEYDEYSNSIIFPTDDKPPACADITVEYDTLCLH